MTGDSLSRLLRSLEDDEFLALATGRSASHLSPRWHSLADPELGTFVLDEHDAQVAVDVGVAGGHMANWSPARVLRLVEAIRDVIGHYHSEVMESNRRIVDGENMYSGAYFRAQALGFAIDALADVYTEEAES